MTKKVTLDKTEYDEMEKEIERLRSINEELVKGASVVIEPEISINIERDRVYSRQLGGVYRTIYKDNFTTNIKTTTESLPKSKHIEGLYKILEDQIKDRLGGYINSKLISITTEKDRLETSKEYYSQKHQEALDELEIVKKGYESRPVKRYVLAGALLALVGNYILGLI